MNDDARQVLLQLIKTQGPSLCADPARCAAFLRDFAARLRPEVRVLITALEERVPTALLELPPGSDVARELARHAQILERARHLTPAAARWSVESWAMALGLVPLAKPAGAVPVVIGDGAATPPRRPLWVGAAAAIGLAVLILSVSARGEPERTPREDRSSASSSGKDDVEPIVRVEKKRRGSFSPPPREQEPPAEPEPSTEPEPPTEQEPPNLKEPPGEPPAAAANDEPAAPAADDPLDHLMRTGLRGGWLVTWAEPTPFGSQVVVEGRLRMKGHRGTLDVTWVEPNGLRMGIHQHMQLRRDPRGFAYLAGGNLQPLDGVMPPPGYMPDNLRIALGAEETFAIIENCSGPVCLATQARPL